MPRRNPVVCGRKFCSACGRWRLLVDFRIHYICEDGEPHYRSACEVCSNAMKRARGRRKREVEFQRRGRKASADAVDSGPFLQWLGRWRAYQDSMRSSSMAEIDRPVASLEDLAGLAKCSPRAFSRAKTTGRISTSIVDRILIAAGGDTMLWELYPELYPDDVEVAA